MESLLQERRNKLTFVNGRPGRRLLKNFIARQTYRLIFRRFSKEQEIRVRDRNADKFKTHFQEITKLTDIYNIQKYRIANLDDVVQLPSITHTVEVGV